MSSIIDSHCHLDFDCFDADRNDILKRCADTGIDKIIIPGVTPDNWQRLIRLRTEHSTLEIAFGCHPMLMKVHPDDSIAKLDDAINEYKPIAVGEIGLDYYLPSSAAEKKQQIHLFEAQLDIAEQYRLPVILHVRKAHDEVLKSLRQRKIVGGIVHAFNGSLQQAKHYAEQNILLGVGGALTYPRAQKMHKLFAELPLSQIVLETDSPDMPLCGHQGQRNSPENLNTILETLAEVRGESIEIIAQSTTKNCQRIFDFQS